MGTEAGVTTSLRVAKDVPSSGKPFFATEKGRRRREPGIKPTVDGGWLLACLHLGRCEHALIGAAASMHLLVLPPQACIVV